MFHLKRVLLPPSKGEKGVPHKVTPQHIKKVICAFKSMGFDYRLKSKKTGNHHILTRKGLERPIVFVEHGSKDIPIRHIKNNVKTAKITEKAYLRALSKC